MIHDSICFHCQQYAEKYLKALLHERGSPIPKNHDCEDLVLLLAAADAPLAKSEPAATGLTQFAVDYRYPGASADVKMSRSAWKAAELIRSEIRHSLGLRPRP
jgi:HEPN domain-containing protein